MSRQLELKRKWERQQRASCGLTSTAPAAKRRIGDDDDDDDDDPDDQSGKSGRKDDDPDYRPSRKQLKKADKRGDK